MKICFETGDHQQEIVDFIHPRNSQPANHCHLCSQDYDALQREITRIFSLSASSILVIRDDEGALLGVFRVLAEPENKYLEMLWGFVRQAEVYQVLFEYFRRVYAGYHLDAVVTKSNTAMYEAYEQQGLVYNDEEIMMTLEQYTPKPASACIVPYAPEYEAGYRAIHEDEGMYWTAERMLNALDRYNVFLAVENGQVVGYTEVSSTYQENEPIQLLVREDCRGRGYGRALLQTAIEANMPKGMVLEVYAHNTPALNLYLSLGFRETVREYMGSMTV